MTKDQLFKYGQALKEARCKAIDSAIAEAILIKESHGERGHESVMCQYADEGAGEDFRFALLDFIEDVRRD
jgi:hypothetical protein